MGLWISYTFIAGTVLLALYLVYSLMMADDNQPRFNRAVLLGCYALSALLPLLYFFAPPTSAGGAATAEIGRPTIIMAAHDGAGAPLWPAIVAAVYLMGVVAVSSRTVVAWVRLRGIIRHAELHESDRYTVAVTDDATIAPFSWGRYIVMNSDDYRDNLRLIELHESIHLRRMHRVDLALARLFETLIWYNPATWLMTSALRTVHEYEADSAVVQTAGVSARDYQMLLIKKAVGRSFPVLANSLNHSNLKKRITMMLKSKSRKARRVRVLALAPALAVAAISVNLPFVARAIDTMTAYALPVGTDSKVSEKPAAMQTVKAAAEDEKMEVFSAAQVAPRFPGGEAELMMYVARNIKFPESELNNPGKHRVIVRFVVKKDGSIGDVDVERSAGPAFDKEAVRVVKTLPKFTPGTIDGKPVNVYYALPVVFQTSAPKQKAAK